MTSPVAAFVSAEIRPQTKGSRGIITDISRVHILKVRGNQLKNEKILVNFFPTLAEMEPERRNDKMGEDVPPQRYVHFTSLELEQNLQQLRNILSEVESVFCFDQMTEQFIKGLTDNKLDTLVVLSMKE